MPRGQSVCLLCRQAAAPLTSIIDLDQKSHRAPKGKNAEHITFWYHPKCFDILKRSFAPSNAPTIDDLGVLASAIPVDTFSRDEDLLNKPIQAEGYRESKITWEGLFSRATRNCLQRTFNQDLLRQLPVEISLMIAELATPCWYLILLGETRRLIKMIRSGAQWSVPCDPVLKKELWISKIHYQGISYISRLDHQPPRKVANVQQYRIKLPPRITKFVASVDSVGMRDIQFIGPDTEAAPDGSPGYRIIETELMQDLPLFSHTALFLTDMVTLRPHLGSEARIWTSPVIPKFNEWNIYPGGGLPSTKSILEYIEFDSHLRGLLVCCANDATIGIHGFSGTTRRFREFVTSMERQIPWHRKYWIYYPFSPGECVLTAWVRGASWKEWYEDNILVFQTSLGKTFTFGPQLAPDRSSAYKYRALVREGDGIITGMYHNTLNLDPEDGLEVGVTCSDGPYRTTDLTPPPLESPIKIPQIPGYQPRNRYLTGAPLEGLTKVQVFRDKQDPNCPCLGVLMFYEDERVEALGQVRWDKDMTEEGSSQIAVAAGKDRFHSYVRDIRSGVSDAELRTSGAGWSRLPERGILVWWFGPWGDYLTVFQQ